MTRLSRRSLLGSGLLLPACLFDGSLKHDFGVVPEALADGWQIATPESVGLSVAALAQIHRTLLREDRFLGSLGLLVIKNGKLVWETYLRSRGDRDRYHHVQSVTKSVTALLLGMARDRGLFDALSRTVAQLFPDEMHGLDPVKRTISLEHLLTMRSGLKFDNVDFDLEMYTFLHEDPLRYILEKPLYAAPGEKFYYRNADAQLVSYALQRLSGDSERSLARRWLFEPLGIHDYYWQVDPTDGATVGGNGLHLKARDLAKIGQLVASGGQWNQASLVSKDWIDAMTSAHVASDVVDASGRPFPYGYFWWLIPNGASAWGNGGQFVLIEPAQQLVLVHLALPDTVGLDGSTLNQFLDLVHELL